ncbi:MAG TPA: phage portal protein [Planctomycetaceae bacterium]|nr:phage portal protein [Planctomycetaceae bacterium]
MLTYLRDKWHAARLKARYERIVQERVLELVESTSGPQAVAEDPGRWTLLGGAKSPLDETGRTDLRAKARRLVVESPHARNLLRLMEIYTVGPGLRLSHALVRPEDAADATDDPAGTSGAAARLVRAADRIWSEFLTANRRHFSYRELARRTWRDGECFLRLYSFAGDASRLGESCHSGACRAPGVRFVDPETIGATPRHPDSHGILTAPGDVETPIAYLRIDPANGELVEAVPAAEIIHTRIGVDSNQKRGVSVFAPVVDVLERFEKWIETELAARRLQASIVLWRKVHGPPSQAAAFADAASSGVVTDPYGSVRRERFRPGTILTTSHGTELQYLQPDTNFGDAVPLGRMVLLCLAAGAGLPEFMLTSDASNANFASTMVAEGPAVKLFQSEQQFFAGEFERLWRWVMAEAIRAGRLPEGFFERVQPEWTFPQLVTRDRPRERREDVRLVQAGVLSRAEVARRDGVDPGVMRAEIAAEE